MAAPTYRAELWLTHLVPQIATIEWTEVLSPGPGDWVELTLTETAPLGAALAEWAALATAAGAYTYTFEVTPSGLVSLTSTATAWVRLTLTQQALLGFEFAANQMSLTATSDQTPRGVHAPEGISVFLPATRSSATLTELRGGRIDSYVTRRETLHHVEVLVQEDDIDALEDGQLYRVGKHRLWHGDASTAYGQENLCGYIDLYPVAETLDIDRVEGDEAEAVLTFLATAGR